MSLTQRWDCSDPTCVLLLVHGMTEHMACYASFAGWCVAHGISVVGVDLPGHGPAAAADASLGDPGPDGWDALVSAAYQSYVTARALYPAVPLVVLGHSMGSYVAQAMVSRYRPDIQGLVLSATSYESRWVTGSSWVLAKLLGLFGATRRGVLFYNIIYGGFNRFFRPVKTPFDWLSRDVGFVSRYMSDPLCMFVPSVRFYSALFSGLYRLYGSALASFPDLPIYVLSGDADPLGKQLRSVMRVVSYHRNKGRRVDTAFYPGGRHVMLAETNALEVYADLRRWLLATVVEKNSVGGVSRA